MNALCDLCQRSTVHTHDVTCVDCCVRWIRSEAQPELRNRIKRFIRHSLSAMQLDGLFPEIRARLEGQT